MCHVPPHLGYGFLILHALVTDIEPAHKVKEAMNEINAARRMRVAAAENAEAHKVRTAMRDMLANWTYLLFHPHCFHTGMQHMPSTLLLSRSSHGSSLRPPGSLLLCCR